MAQVNKLVVPLNIWKESCFLLDMIGCVSGMLTKASTYARTWDRIVVDVMGLVYQHQHQHWFAALLDR